MMKSFDEPEVTGRTVRARARRDRIVGHRASSFADAESWDLAFWQSKTPQERLSALVDIHEDVKRAEEARRNYEQHR